MKWDQQFSVGVRKFDNDHRCLFELVNNLNDAMQAKQGRLVLGQVLARLMAYTKQHFAAEETQMKRTGFAGYEIHVNEHKRFTGKIQEFIREYEQGNVLVSIDLLMLLRNWLEDHVLVTDKQYRAHLNSSGVS